MSRVRFYRNGVQVLDDTLAPFARIETNLAAGSYSYYAIAYDNTGASTTSNSVNVTVQPGANNVPVVQDAEADKAVRGVMVFGPSIIPLRITAVWSLEAIQGPRDPRVQRAPRPAVAAARRRNRPGNSARFFAWMQIGQRVETDSISMSGI